MADTNPSKQPEPQPQDLSPDLIRPAPTPSEPVEPEPSVPDTAPASDESDTVPDEDLPLAPLSDPDAPEPPRPASAETAPDRAAPAKPRARTGSAPRRTGRVRVARPASSARIPKVRATGRVPASTATKRLPRQPTGTQRTGAPEPRPGKQNPVYIAAGVGGVIIFLILLAFSGGGGSRRVSGKYPQKQFDKASDLFNRRMYPEADDVLHDLLANKTYARTDAYQRAKAFHVELHPLAQAERAARREVPPWLDRAGRFLKNATSVEDGAALYDAGRKLADRYPNSAFEDDLHAKLQDLGRYKGQKQSDEAFSRYQEVADQAKTLRKQKAYGDAIRCWVDLKGVAGLDPIAASKIGSRIQEIEHEAAEHVKALDRQAAGLRQEGKADEARQLLEQARPGLRGTKALADLEALLR
jgi:hypothetical protein